MKKNLSVLFVLCLLICMVTPKVVAQSMQNETHNLMLDSFDPQEPATNETPTPIQQKQPSLPQQVKPSEKSISIDINTDLIDFGTVSPTNPIVREITIRLSGTTPAQILYIKKDSILNNRNQAEIADTSCDQGGCSEHMASDWVNTLTFGSGYSCQSQNCDDDFTQDAFRPFSQTFVSLYEKSIGKGNLSIVTLPIKLNVPASQKQGNYTNTITIMTVPNL